MPLSAFLGLCSCITSGRSRACNEEKAFMIGPVVQGSEGQMVVQKWKPLNDRKDVRLSNREVAHHNCLNPEYQRCASLQEHHSRGMDGT